MVPSKESAALQQTVPPPTELSLKQEEAHKEVMGAVKELAGNVHHLWDTARLMIQETETAVHTQGSSTQGQLQKIENQLSALSAVTMTPPPPVQAPIIVQPPNNTVFENKIVGMIEDVQRSVMVLEGSTPSPMDLTVEDRRFLETLSNETLKALEYVKDEMRSSSELGNMHAFGIPIC